MRVYVENTLLEHLFSAFNPLGGGTRCFYFFFTTSELRPSVYGRTIDFAFVFLYLSPPSSPPTLPVHSTRTRMYIYSLMGAVRDVGRPARSSSPQPVEAQARALYTGFVPRYKNNAKALVYRHAYAFRK